MYTARHSTHLAPTLHPCWLKHICPTRPHSKTSSGGSTRKCSTDSNAPPTVSSKESHCYIITAMVAPHNLYNMHIQAPTFSSALRPLRAAPCRARKHAPRRWNATTSAARTPGSAACSLANSAGSQHHAERTLTQGRKREGAVRQHQPQRGQRKHGGDAVLRGHGRGQQQLAARRRVARAVHLPVRARPRCPTTMPSAHRSSATTRAPAWAAPASASAFSNDWLLHGHSGPR